MTDPRDRERSTADHERDELLAENARLRGKTKRQRTQLRHLQRACSEWKSAASRNARRVKVLCGTDDVAYLRKALDENSERRHRAELRVQELRAALAAAKREGAEAMQRHGEMLLAQEYGYHRASNVIAALSVDDVLKEKG